MIAGIGLDLFEIRRFAKYRARPEFLSQLFSPAEIKRMKSSRDQSRDPALLFAVKESVRKALGKEIAPGWFWRRIRIGPGLAINIMKEMKRFRLRKNFKTFHGAACHCRKFAFALTLMEK
jgi:phosphopantetheine--protein transferase-like protein